jgi:hypothetical protein
MASEGPPRTEAILCVRIPCREGRERGVDNLSILTLLRCSRRARVDPMETNSTPRELST